MHAQSPRRDANERQKVAKNGTNAARIAPYRCTIHECTYTMNGCNRAQYGCSSAVNGCNATINGGRPAVDLPQEKAESTAFLDTKTAGTCQEEAEEEDRRRWWRRRIGGG
eukprot:284060-Rhodomonas_salina.1